MLTGSTHRNLSSRRVQFANIRYGNASEQQNAPTLQRCKLGTPIMPQQRM